jgi:RIO-like serine/threonine protein kinase
MSDDLNKDESMTGSEKPGKLTKATLNVLRHLWDAENMTAHFNDVWKASGVTYRGFSLVLNRAEDARLVVRNSVVYASFTLTFAGMMALQDHYTRLYNDRPCEAYRLEMEKFSRLPEGSAAA